MRFWLWHITGVNLVGTYTDRESALAAVRYACESGERAAVQDWALEHGAESLTAETIAEGDALITLAYNPATV